MEGFTGEPEEVVLNLDAADIPLHGTPEERFFHGYYREYCYMPLLFLLNQQPILVRMRSAGRDAAAGVDQDLGWLLDELREKWPATRIILRTDSGFCREPILAACDQCGKSGPAPAVPASRPGSPGACESAGRCFHQRVARRWIARGRHGDRTRDLGIANAALSQLS